MKSVLDTKWVPKFMKHRLKPLSDQNWDKMQQRMYSTLNSTAGNKAYEGFDAVLTSISNIKAPQWMHDIEDKYARILKERSATK